MLNEETKIIREWTEKSLTSETDADWFDKEKFKLKILPFIPPGLELQHLPPAFEEGKYNCFIYAFGLQNEPAFLRKSPRPNLNELVLVNGQQVAMILRTLKETIDPVKGDYVIYQNGGITHAGIYLEDNIVESKWSDGPVFRHHLLAVNPAYGTQISFWEKGDSEKIKQRLIDMDTEYKNRPILKVEDLLE